LGIEINHKKGSRDIVGLIPAGGRASRISPLPCSKELLPVGFHAAGNSDYLHPRVISNYLLTNMRAADIRKAFIILRDGKWDIPSYYGDGKLLDMDLAYLMMDLPYGVPYTLDQAYPFVKDAICTLGFPDMIISPGDAFNRLIQKHADCSADVILGIFPAMQCNKTDMVEVDENGKVTSIHIKPEKTNLQYAWEIAVWTPRFTRFMHNYLIADAEKRRKHNDKSVDKELHVGHVFQAAIEGGLRIDSILFSDGSCLDIGTPEDLIRAMNVKDITF